MNGTKKMSTKTGQSEPEVARTRSVCTTAGPSRSACSKSPPSCTTTRSLRREKGKGTGTASKRPWRSQPLEEYCKAQTQEALDLVRPHHLRQVLRRPTHRRTTDDPPPRRSECERFPSKTCSRCIRARASCCGRLTSMRSEGFCTRDTSRASKKKLRNS